MKIANEITVVIPVYNREKEIKKCLDSIKNQTVRPGHIIVVDDGSTDNTLSIIKEHELAVEVFEGFHKGAAYSRNLGLAEVKTEWTMFFDSDDEMLPNHIEEAVKAITPEVEIIGWEILVKTRENRSRVYFFEIKDLGWNNIQHGYLATLRYMARTSLFRKVGGWNPKVSIWDDVELGVRLLNENPKIRKAPGRNVYVSYNTKSITAISEVKEAEKYLIALREIRKHLPAEHHDWVDLKKAILAADISRDDKALGRRLYDEIENKTLGIRLAYWYRRHGGRGTARLLRPFFSKDK